MRKLLILIALVLIGLQPQIAKASTPYNVQIYIEKGFESNVTSQIAVWYNQKAYSYPVPSFSQNTRTYWITVNVSVSNNGTKMLFIDNVGGSLMCDVIIRNGNPVLLTMTGINQCTAVQGVL